MKKFSTYRQSFSYFNSSSLGHIHTLGRWFLSLVSKIKLAFKRLCYLSPRCQHWGKPRQDLHLLWLSKDLWKKELGELSTSHQVVCSLPAEAYTDMPQVRALACPPSLVSQRCCSWTSLLAALMSVQRFWKAGEKEREPLPLPWYYLSRSSFFI